MKIKKELKNWEASTNQIADLFRKKYFGKDASEYYWIADEIGGVYYINEYFFVSYKCF